MEEIKYICEECKEVVKPEFKTVKLAGNVHKVLLKCGDCGESTPLYYTNAKIRRLQKEQQQARAEGKADKAEELFIETKRRMDELKRKKEGGNDADG